MISTRISFEITKRKLMVVVLVGCRLGGEGPTHCGCVGRMSLPRQSTTPSRRSSFVDYRSFPVGT